MEHEEIILDVDDYNDREIVPSEYFEGEMIKMLVSIGVLDKINKNIDSDFKC